MKYGIGRTGRVVVARFEDKDDVLAGLTDMAKKESIESAVFYLIGGVRQGRVVVGPESDEFPPKPVWREIQEPHEIIGMGTIFMQEGAPKVHMHAAFGKGDNVKVGCLRENSGTFLLLEAVVMEIEGIDARREFDPASGLTLLKV